MEEACEGIYSGELDLRKKIPRLLTELQIKKPGKHRTNLIGGSREVASCFPETKRGG